MEQGVNNMRGILDTFTVQKQHMVVDNGEYDHFVVVAYFRQGWGSCKTVFQDEGKALEYIKTLMGDLCAETVWYIKKEGDKVG